MEHNPGIVLLLSDVDSPAPNDQRPGAKACRSLRELFTGATDWTSLPVGMPRSFLLALQGAFLLLYLIETARWHPGLCWSKMFLQLRAI